ncbi:MAG: phytoene/squalene synthase family protein [Chloroflexota bacterium]
MHRVTSEPLQRHAQRLMRSRARTFYLASLFLEVSIRRDVHAVYAYFRVIDDLVDEPGNRSRDQILDFLMGWQECLAGRRSLSEPLLCEVLRIADRHRVPYEFLTMVIDGARFDLDINQIETLDELIHYSELVAGSVGVVMAYILGTQDPLALAAANDLGVAMQITNVLRDVGEDLGRGRVYLPQSELRRAGCTLETLRREEITPSLRQVMQVLIGHARVRYQRGLAGIPHLDRSAQFAVYLAATLYAQILVKIERRDFDVFSRRASLGHVEKWMLALPAYAHCRELGL